MKSADLHLHTVFSDSTYTPQALIKEAKDVGLDCISVVDHDTVAGIDECIKLATSKGIEVIPGIEVTCEYQEQEVHILGYLIDYENKALREKLDELKRVRVERIYKIIDKLNNIGIDLKSEDVFALAKEGTVGRLHVARAMLKEGLVGSVGEAFQKYIGEDCPAFVLGFKLTPSEAISLIKNSKGIPVLAHPYSLKRDDLIPPLVDLGIMGLEVYYPEHTSSMVRSYLSVAKKYNLLITGGSDCHGDIRPEAKLGSVKIPYILVEKIKLARK
ncbi:MAG: PHP domain-containing protein [Candidatus Omnitrophica bacterium]|nr:PHP domain-containing protein [Candidatus Omnitrophota bacterium]